LRFAAPVVRVVLEEAVHLPGRQQSPDAVSERFQRCVNETDGPANSGGQRRGNLRARDGYRPGQSVGGTLVAGLGEGDRGYRCDVPHIHRAHCGIADWGKELALSGYAPGERE
jgi:hypothetical protein